MKNLKWLCSANTTLNYGDTLSKCSKSYILSSLSKKKQIFELHFEILTITFFYRVSKMTIYIIDDSKIRKLVFDIGHKKVWTFPQLKFASKIRFQWLFYPNSTGTTLILKYSQLLTSIKQELLLVTISDFL